MSGYIFCKFFLNVIIEYCISVGEGSYPSACTNLVLCVFCLDRQQTATSTNYNPCGKSVGTLTKVWCTIFGFVSEVPSNRGGLKPWRRPSSACSRRVSRYHKLPASMTSRTRRSSCTPTASTTCSAHQLMVAQVSCQVLIPVPDSGPRYRVPCACRVRGTLRASSGPQGTPPPHVRLRITPAQSTMDSFTRVHSFLIAGL